MIKLSAESTLFYKWVCPLCVGVFVVFVAIKGYHEQVAQGKSGGSFIMVALVMGALFCAMWRRFAWDLANEVWLDHDAIVIRSRDKEERIALSNVMNVNDLTVANWPRVTLQLREPSKLGEEIAFSPKGGKGFVFGGRNRVVQDLIARIDKARLQSHNPQIGQTHST